MRTGKAAKIFGLDTNTVADWTTRFSDFFTPAARGEVQTQREYQPEDLIVINTIRAARKQNATWEKIRADLVAGHRVTQLPPEAMNIQGDNAMQVYTELRTLQLELKGSLEENTRLRTELNAKDTAMTEKEKEIRELERAVGRWQAMAEMYEKMWKEEKGSDK
ncbi:MAG: MerR family transcriptional regulator [Chloroflexota bacterium]